MELCLAGFLLAGSPKSFTADMVVARGISSLGERGRVFDSMIKSGGMQMQNSLYGDLMDVSRRSNLHFC